METVRQKLRGKLRPVHDFEGIQITCESTECVFEFTVYKYRGEGAYPPPPPPDEIRRMAAEEERRILQGTEEVDFPQAPGELDPQGHFGYPPGVPPGSGPHMLPYNQPQKQGSIALVFPIDMFPELSVTNIEQFLAGSSNIQISARGPDTPVRFVLKNYSGPTHTLGHVPTPRANQLRRPFSLPADSRIPFAENQDDNRRTSLRQSLARRAASAEDFFPPNQRRIGAEVRHQQLPSSTASPIVNGHTVQTSTMHQPDNDSSLV